MLNLLQKLEPDLDWLLSNGADTGKGYFLHIMLKKRDTPTITLGVVDGRFMDFSKPGRPFSVFKGYGPDRDLLIAEGVARANEYLRTTKEAA